MAAAGSDELYGADSLTDNVWAITSSNSGTLTNNGNIVTFNNIIDLIGGSGVDSFTVTGTVSTINAGDGDNNITVNNGGTVFGAITGGTGNDTIVTGGCGQCHGRLD